jgi:hypothetical protein
MSDSPYSPKEGELSYTWELLSSIYCLVPSGVVGLLIAAAMVWAPGLAIVLTGMYLTMMAMTLMVVPKLSAWKNYVNSAIRAERREADKNRLLNELNRFERIYRGGVRSDNRNSSIHLKRFKRIEELVRKFHEMAVAGTNDITASSAERIEDQSLKYLGYWLSTYTLRNRRSSDTSEIVERIKAADALIEKLESSTSATELMKARRVREDRDKLQRVLERRGGIDIQITSAENKMLGIYDDIEELYTRCITNQGGTNDYISDMLSRREEEQELEAGVDMELEAALNTTKKAAARKAAAAKNL